MTDWKAEDRPGAVQRWGEASGVAVGLSYRHRAGGWVDLDTWDRSELLRRLFLPSADPAGWPDLLRFEPLRARRDMVTAGWP